MSDLNFSVSEIIYEEDESLEELDSSEMGNQPNDFSDDFMSKVDDSWMMNEADEWNMLQNNAQNLREMIDRLESTVKECLDRVVTSTSGKFDFDETENLLKQFKSRWQAKCKEAENLRISLKRTTHESTRVNDHYHEMENSISKMRQQFGQAIDNSVTEIEELSICNSSLSETIHELEGKIRRGDKAFKQNARDNLSSLRDIITLANEKDVNLQTLRTRLKKEADKIDRMIIVEDLFAVNKTGDGRNSSLAEKSQKMVDAISQGLVETLKGELQECRKIVDSQRQQIKNLEQEKEEFLENQLQAKNDGVQEMNEIVETLRQTVAQKKEDGANDASDINIVKRNFIGIKRMLNSLNDGLDKSYKKVTSKSSEIIDLKDNIKDLNQQTKVLCTEKDNISEERNYFKMKYEQAESQYNLANDELHTIQKRLKMLDGERKALMEETAELKGGKENMEGVCTSLTGENEKLGDKLLEMQLERDKVFTDLHEQIQKLNQYSIENNELEHKCEIQQQTVQKLTREYQDQTRAMNMLTREHEELKSSLQDSEQERLKLRRNMKSVETANKDLEDQIFELTNQNQKLKSEINRVLTNQKSKDETYNDLTEKLNTAENERTTIENELKTLVKQQKQTEETNKTLSSSLHQEKQVTCKRQVLLHSYEKLLIKLLHQRKQMLRELDMPKEFQEIHLQVSSTQSLDYKEVEQIEESFKSTADEAELTYNAISSHSQELKSENTRFKNFCDDLLDSIKSYEELDKDSCYSTENDVELVPHVPRHDVRNIRRGLIVIKAMETSEAEHLQKLLGRVKRCMTRNTTHSLDEVSDLKHKLKVTTKKLKQLKLKLRNRKSFEYSMKNKIKHLKEESKVLKSFHRSFHEKVKSPSQSPRRENPIIGFNIDMEEVLKELKNAEEELVYVRKLLNECSCEAIRNEIGERLEKVDCAVSRTAERISSGKTQTSESGATDSQPDELSERMEALSDQRQYMLEHLTFTNKRLEVLLGCLKGKELDTDNNNNNNPEETNTVQPTYTRRVLKRVRASFKNDQEAMKRAVSILELTKAISVTDLTELSENKAVNDEHREMIVLVKNMNDKMESVLREARSNITDGKVKGENQSGDKQQLGEKKVEAISIEVQSTTKHEPELIPKSELLKKENELQQSLENAQKKVDKLSQFLEQREAELKERDETIAKLNKEYVELKSKASDLTDLGIITRDRMIKEYLNEKKRLEKENEFLQMVVKEVREELLNFQKTFRKEEETQQHLQEFVNELQVCKSSLEQSLDKIAFELNIVKRDRDHLMGTIHEMGMRNSYRTPYYDPAVMHHNMYSGYHGDPYYNEECSICSYQDYSLSTTFPLSEEEWECTASCTDDFESLPSDVDQGDGVVSSSESHTTTSSRVAKNMKTEEATEVIKSKNRPEKYLKQETRSGRTMLSPKLTRTRSGTMPDGDPFDAISIGSNVTTTNASGTTGRVQGRREQSFKSSNRDSGAKSANSRRSSQESVQTARRMTEPKPNRNSFPGYHNHISSPTLESSPVHTPVYAPVTDINAAINMAAQADQQYYERKKAEKASRNQQLVTPFLSPGYDVSKKRKKKFLAFGKKSS